MIDRVSVLIHTQYLHTVAEKNFGQDFFSIGFKSGDYAGHFKTEISFSANQFLKQFRVVLWI